MIGASLLLVLWIVQGHRRSGYPDGDRKCRQLLRLNRGDDGCSSVDENGGKVAPRSGSRQLGCTVCVLDSSEDVDTGDGDVARSLATQLSLPLVSSVSELLSMGDNWGDSVGCTYTHVLSLVQYECGNVQDYAVGISVIDPGKHSRGTNRNVSHSRKKRKLTMNPFYVDFCPPESSRLGRRSNGQSGLDLLIKAVAPQKGFPQGATVYDLTAGFGQDSLLIANAGAKSVHMVERDPVVAILLADALRRLNLLSQNSNSNEAVRNYASRLSRCFSLDQGDGVDAARQLSEVDRNERPDIIYLDPMFPDRKKAASVKKNMQILHSLLSSQDIALAEERMSQEEALLNAAYEATKVRLVVKRAINAPLLGNPETSNLKPAHSVIGPVNRWDVYVKGRLLGQ